jgi:hypothetical protein
MSLIWTMPPVSGVYRITVRAYQSMLTNHSPVVVLCAASLSNITGDTKIDQHVVEGTVFVGVQAT